MSGWLEYEAIEGRTLSEAEYVSHMESIAGSDALLLEYILGGH